MKSTLKLLSIGIACELAGVFILCTSHETSLLIWGLIGAFIGLWIISYELVKMIGSRNVYEFYHYYKHKNHLDNETPIIYKIPNKDLAQLNLYDENWGDIFIHQPILVRRLLSLTYTDEGETQVHGFIIASNKTEAIRTLHYTTDFEQYIQTEIPVYSGVITQED